MMKRTILTLLALTVVLGLSAQLLSFNYYDKNIEGNVKGGGMANLNLSFAYPEPAGAADVSAMRKAVSSIVNESALATEFGKVVVNQPISRMADFYVAAFTRGLRTGATYPMTNYTLTMQVVYQSAKVVTINVADGIWGNGGPLPYYVTVRRSDGSRLNTSNLIDMTDDQLRTLLKSYYECESEYDAETLNNISVSDVRCSIHGEGLDILWTVSSHFSQDVVIPYKAIEPYLTPLARSLF